MTLSDVKLSPIVDSSDGRPESSSSGTRPTATSTLRAAPGAPAPHHDQRQHGRAPAAAGDRSWLTTSAIDAPRRDDAADRRGLEPDRPSHRGPPSRDAAGRFILETRPAKPRSHPKGHIAQSHERPVYTALTPSEIRERLRLPALRGSRTRRRSRAARALAPPRPAGPVGPDATVVEAGGRDAAPAANTQASNALSPRNPRVRSAPGGVPEPDARPL